ncbi:response regulator [Candidatus Saccharibacteria bacterium]|nr:response regulator [Candidatus Saccharibacteria bacterium]MCL1962739.1 response regulator [Candidatus Saccharibacteria bacterium]
MEDNFSAANGKVLVIEDDIIVGELYVNSLSDLGYEVTWAQDGEAGLKAALQQQYDVILLDIIMPEKDGRAILRELRAHGDKVPNSKIIVFTNLAQDDGSRSEVEKYADDYLIKADIKPSQLIAKIEQLLSKSA